MLALPTVDSLDAISIPVPCQVPWDAMRGDGRTRYCGECRQHVHDVSELTRAEAVRLVAGGAEPPCLRLFRRADGRVMTADCAGRRERAWKWLHGHSPWAAAAFAAVMFAGCDRPVTHTAGIPAWSRTGTAPPEHAVQAVVGVPAVEGARGNEPRCP